MDKQKTILAVDDEPSMRRLLEISLRQAGYQPVVAADGKEALQMIRNQTIDLVVSDLHMPSMNGLELLKNIRLENETLPFIMVTAQGEIKTAVEAMKLGASDYILRPFDLETLEIAIAKALSVKRLNLENTYLKSNTNTENDGLVGLSAPMMALKQLIRQVAPEKATVLITGETGTGKELVAKAIHQHSDRKNALFVAVNCAAIPAEMLESELFGYEKGAFTGAVKDRMGKFELAEGGTIFLDEITEMPINLQAKLLRALQEGVIEKLGGNRQITLDIRVIAATNRDPLQAVKEGKLREDLYYRLNVFQLQIPALRERGDDIGLITQDYLAKKAAQLSDEALQKLNAYTWPGNVRELQNVLERAAILAGGKPITSQHLPADLVSSAPLSDIQPSASLGAESANSNASPVMQMATQGFSIPQTIAQIERQLIVDAIAACKGNKSKAAKLLEISERSLWYKLEQYQLK
ncbi:MAG TPA: sigma-54 dependent transcriptional regulator [Methylotenera sp.]|nr:sigma-54 dependent transcriptional regulator [Methylotenera sp.]HPM49325.1 sigma-54 dependent transcriptional regulator [Methylotenera sp.]HQM86453.1 sigma-54 dependent transcriptional regulator [Methylotenera sp.]